MKFSEIPQLIKPGHYQVNVPLHHVQTQLKALDEDFGLDLQPDFQRGHVWTEEQQTAYVEFLLSGGRSARIIYFNCIGWMGTGHWERVQCVDGLQRLTAVQKFLNNQLPIFGGNKYEDFEDSVRTVDADLLFNINNLPTRKLVLQWYLQMNSGGTPHTKEDLDKVRRLYELEE